MVMPAKGVERKAGIAGSGCGKKGGRHRRGVAG